MRRSIRKVFKKMAQSKVTTKGLSIEPLGVDNYASWSADMKWLMVTKGCWSAIDGEADDAMNAKALALIGLHVERHIKGTIVACDTASEAWSKLEAVYKAKSNARRLWLKRELTNLRREQGEPITVYVARARGIKDELAAAGHEISDEEVAWSVLAGLPEEYASMVNAIETTMEKMDLDVILSKLLIIENRTEYYDMDTGRRILRACYGKARPWAPSSNTVCWNCGKKGHVKRDCREKPKTSNLVAL